VPGGFAEHLGVKEKRIGSNIAEDHHVIAAQIFHALREIGGNLAGTHPIHFVPGADQRLHKAWPSSL